MNSQRRFSLSLAPSDDQPKPDVPWICLDILQFNEEIFSRAIECDGLTDWRVQTNPSRKNNFWKSRNRKQYREKSRFSIHKTDKDDF